MNRLNTEYSTPPTLMEALKTDRCTLIAGPLISLRYDDRLGLPSPKMLALELADQMGLQLDNYNLPKVAEIYTNRYGRYSLIKYVLDRFYDQRYCPTLSQHLIAQLPFQRIVYTAQDRLLRMAHEVHRVPASYILPGESLSYVPRRTILQLYGSVDQPESLRLTEAERRRVWQDMNGLLYNLRTWAHSDTLLFLGYAANDPELSDLYYQIRDQNRGGLEIQPRAYIVSPGVSPDDINFWDQRHATLILLDTPTFLEKLAQEMDERKLLSNFIDLSVEQPPTLSKEELREQDRLKARIGEKNQGIKMKVFLCHWSGDKPAVREIYRQLLSNDMDPWLDEEKLVGGHEWELQIPEAVRAAHAVVVCLSKGSVHQEGYVQKEIRYALDIADEKPDGTIYIIPLRLEPCDVPRRLSKWQWINYYEMGGYEKLIKALKLRAESLGLD